MRVLLDTHALLWFLLDDPRLSRVARDLIAKNPFGAVRRSWVGSTPTHFRQ